MTFLCIRPLSRHANALADVSHVAPATKKIWLAFVVFAENQSALPLNLIAPILLLHTRDGRKKKRIEKDFTWAAAQQAQSTDGVRLWISPSTQRDTHTINKCSRRAAWRASTWWTIYFRVFRFGHCSKKLELKWPETFPFADPRFHEQLRWCANGGYLVWNFEMAAMMTTMMRATLSVNGRKACVSDRCAFARFLGRRPGYNPKLAGPSVAHKHSSPHREGCARWPPWKPPRLVHPLSRVVLWKSLAWGPV